MGIINILLRNGRSIELGEEQQIEWVQENMLWEEDVALRSKYSFPFSINRNANSDVLAFSDEMAVNNKVYAWPCLIKIGGNDFYKGQLNVLDWTDTEFNVAITRDRTEFDTSLYIDELNLPRYIGAAEASARNADINKMYPEVDIAWPQIYNFNEDNIGNFGLAGSYQGAIIENYRNGDTEAANGNEVITPHFYLLAVIKAVLKVFNLTMVSTLQTDDYFKKLIINNSTMPIANVVNSCFLKSEKVTWDVKKNTVFLQNPSSFSVPTGAIFSFDIYELDAVGAVVNTFTFSITTTAPDVATYTDFMKFLRDGMLAVATGATLHTEDYTAQNPYYTLFFASGNEMDIRSKGAPRDQWNYFNGRDSKFLTSDFGFNLTYADVQMAYHLPHITVSNFLTSIKNFFNLSITLDERSNTVFIERRKDLITYANKPNYSNLQLEQNEGLAYSTPNYRINFDNDSDVDSETQFLSDHANNYPEHVMQPRETKETSAGILNTEILKNSTSGNGEMPRRNQVIGNYGDKKDFGLRFLYYNGNIADTNGKYYAMANTTWLTPNEIYTQYYKIWYNLLRRLAKGPTIFMNFGLSEITNFPLGPWNVNKNDFYWKRCTTIMHNTRGILVTKVEGYK